jgi:hypothetical protein
VLDGVSEGGGLPQRGDSQASQYSVTPTPARNGTLKKKPSLSRKGSLKRSSSRRSLRSGSVRSLNLGEKEKYGGEDANSAFYVPIPTNGSPTDVLVNRFQAWRRILKDLIVFFKDIHKSYEMKSKLLLSTANIISNISLPPTFLDTGGLTDATEILRDSNKQAIAEANKARELENEVIQQLTGLRSDLQQKIKEIKNLSGDFKNTVEKEVESTRKTVRHLQEALGLVDVDPSATSGKHDPFIIRLAVDRQIEKQIEEENYLHRAYLNLENSGRELESIVVGEIQKAYNAYASILKREADVAYDTVDQLRAGPVSMPKDREWNHFITESDHLVDPRVPVRNVEHINYPGKDHPAAVEVRSGMLERKSKYLKSYTPGWYVLSPTHLHEFKSADRISFQTPVVSLYLPEQKLGSHSQPGSTSHKFMLKGRQTGAMHRGHAWVFRAESHETMMAWYEDIASLIGKTGEARNAFVRRHMRSLSGGSHRASSISSDGAMDEDEADRTPYSGSSAVFNRAPTATAETQAARPRPGGRFPSDIQVDRHLHAELSRSSGESSGDREVLVEAGALPGSGVPFTIATENEEAQSVFSPNGPTDGYGSPLKVERHDSYYGDWMGSSNTGAARAMTISSTDSDRLEQSQQDAISQHDQLVSLLVRKGTGSDAPIVLVPSTAERRESPAGVPGTEPGSASGIPSNAVYNTITASVAASEKTAAGQLKRQESQRSKQSLESTASALTSSPASGATSPWSLKASLGGVDSQLQDSIRAAAKSKESISTMDLQIPGRYPRTPIT